MGSSENPSCFLDCSLIDEIPNDGGDFAANDGGGFCLSPQGFNPSSTVRSGRRANHCKQGFRPPPYSNKRLHPISYLCISFASVDIDSSFVNSESLKQLGSAKRVRSESCSRPASKACREKMRRAKLNDRFMELSSLFDPGKPPMTDKAAILSDLRTKSFITFVFVKIYFSLQAEKNVLRDEKQKLKAEMESLEQRVKLLNARPSYLPHPPLAPSLFPTQSQAAGHKLMVPIMGFPMWQFMAPTDVDTSQDADKCPPVA
ncbi:hypothetical protein MUK42_26733 [Musa troglodytarum]|uniref:BHLH domain-containing protein n=1 Tax=Musa troglodytarum TaxID=320322 RepID=A0A9E7F3B7_9LILI|nr:hypothetical protein MUK42_26733 [Musa troglodytarum]